jgi:hypothetical protein
MAPIMPPAKTTSWRSGARDFGLGQGIGREGDRRRRRAIAQRFRTVGEVEQAITAVAIVAIAHGEALTGLARHVDDQIGAHGRSEHHPTAVRRVGLDRLAVDGNHFRLVASEFQAEYPGIGGVDQAQADALAAADGEAVGDRAVHRHRISDPAIVACIHHIAEIALDLGGFAEPPVVQYPGQIAVHGDRLGLFDDQGAVEASPDLLGTALVGVVPVRAGVWDGELVDEAPARGDRLLGEMGHPVHGVGDAQAVPVDGGLFGETVLDHHSQGLALADPKLRARNGTVEGPDGGLGVRRRGDPGKRRRKLEGVVHSLRGRGAADGASHRGEETGAGRAGKEVPPVETGRDRCAHGLSS